MIYYDCPFCFENWNSKIGKEDGTFYCVNSECNIKDCDTECEGA